MRKFALSCSWLGVDGEKISARDPETALTRFASENQLEQFNVCETWPEEGADRAGGFGQFKGQEWSNGDYNIESVSCEEVRPLTGRDLLAWLQTLSPEELDRPLWLRNSDGMLDDCESTRALPASLELAAPQD